jgi:hypothetical protein
MQRTGSVKGHDCLVLALSPLDYILRGVLPPDAEKSVWSLLDAIRDIAMATCTTMQTDDEAQKSTKDLREKVIPTFQYTTIRNKPVSF